MTEAQTEANRWTKDPGLWPNKHGDYCLLRDDGRWRWWIDRSTFGEDAGRVAEAMLAVLNGGVVLPSLPDNCIYTLRPVSPPAAPTVERVHWWEAKGRRLPSGAKVYSVTDDANGVRVWGDPWPAPIDADGMVSVLADDIEGERS